MSNNYKCAIITNVQYKLQIAIITNRNNYKCAIITNVQYKLQIAIITNVQELQMSNNYKSQ
jgi:hypothetical protein